MVCVGVDEFQEGDFNVFRFFWEKLNATRATRSMRDFDGFIGDMDLGNIPSCLYFPLWWTSCPPVVFF